MICFCRNTKAKRNPVKAVREGPIIFRFERPTSRKSAECNERPGVSGVFGERNHRINIGRFPKGGKVGLDFGLVDWNLD